MKFEAANLQDRAAQYHHHPPARINANGGVFEKVGLAVASEPFDRGLTHVLGHPEGAVMLSQLRHLQREEVVVQETTAGTVLVEVRPDSHRCVNISAITFDTREQRCQ